MKSSRTKNVAKNVVFSTVFQMIAYVMGFVARTFFIKLLGEEYLGLNGVFTNVLTILSFAELGIGTAITYSMYKPLAENNEKKLKQLINYYKKIYFLIGTSILVLGIIFIPFLRFIITDAPNIKENLTIIYLIFVLNSAISYFYAYRTSIISADQKNYLVIVYNKVFHIIRLIVQILVLFYYKNYYVYLLIETVSLFLANYLLARKSKKLYPNLVDIKNEQLPEKEKHGLINNVRSLIVYKFAGVALNGTDNIIISRYLGLAAAGLYSNYQLLTNAIVEVIGQVTASFTASVGNLNSVATKEKKEDVFYKLLYFTFLLFGVVSICLVLLLNDFVRLWIGEKFVLSLFTVVMIVGHIYVNGVQYASFSYRNTLGLFKEAKIGPIIAVILNIGLSILFAKTIGLAGIFLATIIARFFSFGLVDPIMVYKYEFKKSPVKYYFKYFNYLAVVLLTGLLCYFVTKGIVITNIVTLFIKGVIVLATSGIVLILATFWTKEFKGLLGSFLYLLKRKTKGE